jgi:hypothetical protein
MCSWLYFQMNKDNYPHITIFEDGRLCSTGHHCLGFPRVLYDALLHLSYNGDVPVYRSRMSTTHSQDRCEVSVMITLTPMESWGAIIAGIELDETVEQAAHIALTAQCESRLNDTVAMLIALFPIHKQEDPMWKQRLQAVTDPEGHHFHTDMVAMTVYTQYMFNLLQNTIKTVVHQHLWLTLLEQHVEGLRHENAILHSGMLPPSNQDYELQVVYRCLSEAEHGWHYARQQLDAARAMVDECTHTIIHLEHHIEQ